MYEALILLSELINPSIEDYAHKIESFYQASSGEKPRLSFDGDGVVIKFKDIEFTAIKNCAPTVLIESKELSELAVSDSKQEIAKSKCRIELSSTSDLDMLYFNDFIYLVQSAEELGNVWAFNPAQGEFM